MLLLMLRLQLHHPLSLQPAAYHNFADKRAWLGVPNFLNVASNLPFAVIGVWGIAFITQSNCNAHDRFLDPRERWPYLTLFAGLILTAFGSAYYHLWPGNGTLVWDRMPMAVVFGSFIAAVVCERLSVHVGLRLLPFLLIFCVASVLQWYYSELHGQGDLRWYAAVQIYSILILVTAPFLPPRYTRSWDFIVVFACYAAAKMFETFDGQIYWYFHVVSGHTLKHLAAAAAGYWILRMLQQREPLAAEFTAR
jgi:hypothetical protein